MERCQNIAMKRHVQPCRVVHDTNICGPMANIIKNQRRFQPQNILNVWWIGPKDKSITKRCSRFQQTYHSRSHFPTCVGKYWRDYFECSCTFIYITLIVSSVLARWVRFFFRKSASLKWLQFKADIEFSFESQEAHVNTCYKHFYYFVNEFEVVSPKELEPLAEMTAHVCKDQWTEMRMEQKPVEQTTIRTHTNKHTHDFF